MNTKLKTLLPLLALASCVFTANAFADNQDDMHNKQQVHHGVPPAKYPGGENANSFFLGASYTWWLPYQSGMNIAYAGDSLTTPGNIARPDTWGVSGFKVHAAANTNHDGMVASANYTWFYFAPKNLKTNNLKEGAHYIATFNDENVSYFGLSSLFGTLFQRVDAEIDRCLYAGHYLSFRPWLGLLGAWDTQHLKFYGNISGGANTEVQFANMRQTWWGIGPYTGVEATYFFTGDWGLYISSGTSMLYTSHYVTNNNTSFDTAGSELTTVVDFSKTTFYNVEPMLEVGLGLRWDANWESWGLCVDFGWDLQTYFKHNGFLGFYSPVGSYGNFSMQGLTATVKVNF